MKYTKHIIGWFIAGLVLSYGLSVAATTLQGFQGGTGYATTSASNMGNFLQVASTSPYLTYTFGTSTGGTGTLSGNGTSTQVAFYTALQTLSSSLNLFWDNVNSRLGIGTSTPTYPLYVAGNVGVDGFIRMTSTTTVPTVTSDNIYIHNHSGNGVPQLHVHSAYTLNSCDDLVGDNCVTVKNTSGGGVTIGQAVYVNGGGAANLITVGLAQANASSTSKAIGLVATTSAANNDFMFAVQAGDLTGLNTSGFNAGDVVYLSPTVAGGITSTRPTYPYYVQRIGTVTRVSATVGEIMVSIAPAVLGQETGTVSPIFNVGGSNAVTTSSINQYAITSLVGGTGISVSSSSGAGTITNIGVTSLSVSATSGLAISSATGTPILYNNGVTSTQAGTGIGIALNGGTATITNNGVQSLTASSSIGLSNSTGTINIGAKDYLAPAEYVYTTSTSNWDDVFWIPKTTSTLTYITGVNSSAGDTVTFNICWGASRNTASSTANCAFTSYQTLTSTSTPTVFTINGSSTVGLGQPVRILSYNASSSESLWNTYFTPN